MKHSFWKRFLALVMAIAIVLSTGVLDSAGWLLANNGEDTTQEPTGENTTPPSDQQGGSSTETLDLTTDPTGESTGATDPSEGGETTDATTESTPVKEVTLTVVIQSVYADASQEDAVLGTEYLTYAEGEASKTIAVAIPAVEGYTFAVSGADMTLNAEGKYEASLARPAESGMLYITVTYSPIVPEGEEGTEPETPAEGEETTEPETPAEGEETVTGPVVNVTVVYAYIGGVKEETSASYTVTFGEEETEKTFSLAVPQDPGYTYMLDTELDFVPAGDNTFVFTFARPEADTSAEIYVFYAADTSAGSQDVYEPDAEDTPFVDTYKFVVDGADYAEVKVIEGQTVLLPEAPQKDGFKFIGWNNSSEAKMDTETGWFQQPTSVTGAEDPYVYYAVFEPGYYLFFADEQGRVKETYLLVSGDTFDTTNHKILLDNKNLAITGWSLTPVAPNTEGVKALGTVKMIEEAEEGQTVTVLPGNKVLYPITVTAFSVTYDTQDGSFMDSDFYYGNELTKDPATIPGKVMTTRPGYTFQGWYTDAACTTSFGWGGKLTESVVVYAKWEASQNTNYTVIYWIENADDDDYSFESKRVNQGTTGATITLGNNADGYSTDNINSSYRAYFTFKEYDTGKTIAADGTTVVNVYYSRNSYTLTFKYNNTTVATITAKYDANIAGEFAKAPFNTTYNGRAWEDSDESTYDYPLQTLDRMPGANETFKYYENDNNKLRTMYYWVETVDSQTFTQTKQYGGRTYGLLKTVQTYFNYMTYDEEYHVIEGFDRFSASDAGFYNSWGTVRKDWSNGEGHFYYTRKSYELMYMNGENEWKTVSVPYQALLNSYVATTEGNTPATRPAGIDSSFTFGGWYTSPACEDGKEATSVRTMPLGGLVVYAKWDKPTNNAQVYFDIILENGSTTISVPYGELIADYLPEDYDSVEDLVQLSEGLRWDNQWLEIMEDGSFKAFFDINAPITRPVRIAPNITSTERYSVTYDLNDGTGSVTDSKVYYRGAYADVAYANGVTKDGYVFLGWSDGTKTWQPGDKFQVSKNVTLTAVWGAVPKKVSVTHNSNYPAISGLADTTYTTEAVTENNTTALATLNATGFTTPTGYRFGGWQNAAGKVFAEGASVLVTTSGDNTVYAVWIPLTYNVTYKYEGDVPTNADALPAGTEGVAYGSTFTVAGQPAAVDGYAFEGWKLNGSVVTSFTMPAGNVELVGTWTKLDFKVTYQYTGTVPAGAPEVPAQATVTMDQNYTVADDPEVDGYTFNGWLKDGEEVTSFKMPASDVTLIGSFSKRTDLGYIVKYVWGETELISTTKEVSDQTFGTTVTESAIDIDGYTLNDDASKSITITTGENVIVFHYNKDVTFTGETAEKVYTGSEQTITKIDDEGLKTGHTYDEEALTYAAKGTNVGTYDGAFSGDVIIKDANGNDVTKYYNVTKTPGKLTITKASLNLVITGKSDTKTYNGSEQEVTGFESEGLLTGHTITGLTHTAKGTNVGEYTGSFTGTVKVMDGETDVTENYAITQNPGKLTITASSNWELTATGYENVYDAQAHAATASANVAEGTTISYKVGEGEWTTTAPTITDVGEVTVQVKAENPNYNTLTTTVTLKVTPATLTIVTPTDSKVYDGTALTKDGTITGFVGGETATFETTGSQTAVGSSPNTYTLTWNGTASASNYEIKETIGTLTVTEYAEEIVVTTTGGTFTYDGQAHGATVKVSELPKGYTVQTAVSTSTATDVTTGEGVFATADILEIRNAAGENVTSNLKIKYVDGKIVINPRSVTLTSATDSKTYDGTPLTNSKVTVGGDGFVEGEGATYNVTGTITDVGSVDNAFTYTLKDGTKASNYNINKVEGKLTISKITTEIVITADSNSKTYDGQPLTDDGYTYTQNVLAQGDELTAVVEGSRTDVGDAANVVTSYKVMRGETDVTANYTFGASVDGTLTVTKRSVTLTSATDSKEYDGKALTNSEVTVSGDGFVNGEGATYAVTGSQTLVGSSDNKFTYTLNEGTNADNYEIKTVFGKLTVTDRTEKYKITVEANSGEHKYDGTEKTASGFKTLEFEVEGNTYTVEGLSASNTQTNAGTYDVVIEGTAAVKDANGNDVTAQFTVTEVDGKLVINNREVILTSATDSKTYDGTALTNSKVTVSGDGFVTGEGATYTVTGSQLTVGSSNNEFTYELNEKTNADNYEIKTVFGKLTVTDRDAKFEITVVANSDSKTYDGQPITVEGFETLSFTVNGQNYTVEGLSASETQTQAGTYAVVIKGEAVVKDAAGNDVTGQFTVHKTNGSLVINKAALTITADNASKVYDGTALTKDSYTNTTLAAGDEIASVTVTGSQTIVGTSANVPSAAVIKNAAGEDVTASYDITYANGTLEVTKKSITITADNATKTYDGTALVKNSYTNSALGAGDKIDSVTVTGSKTAVGTASNVPTNAKIVNATGEDVTKSYDITYVNGTLEVTKRKVTLTSATDSKEYDGKALTNSEVTVSGDGFVNGEGATYAVTGSQTLVGTSENTFTYALKDGTAASNYEIETVFGKLTVTDRTEKYKITVEANSGEHKYDGTEKNASGFKTLTFTVNEQKYTVEGLTASNTQVGAGTYAVVIEGEAVVKDANGNDVTAQFKVTEINGTLEITKREVTLTSATDSKTYDGTALTNSEVTVSGDGFVTGEGATYTVTGSQLTVGSSDNTFTYELNEKTNADNYEIKTVFGKLTVTDRDAKFEITVVANSGEFKYDGTEKNVSGFKTLTFTVNGQTYTVEGLSASNTQTDAGTYTVEITGTAAVKDAAGNDVTAQFKVTEIDGQLVITKRSVTLTSGDGEKVYDGTALTNSDVTVSGDGFAEGEGAEYSVTGTITNVGDVKNEFTYTLNDNTKEGNYEITKVEGTLKVTPVTDKVTVTITEHGDTRTYNGSEQSVSGYDVDISNDLYKVADFTFKGDDTVKGTEVGTYNMELKPSDFTNNSKNFTNVEFVIEDGQLVIKPLEVTVTITENSDSLVYNGKEQKVEGYQVTSISNDLFKEDMIVFTGEAVAKGTVVGTYDMELTPDQFASSDAKNFTVTFVIVGGQLEITPVTDKVTVTITGHKDTDDYNGTEHSVSGYDVEISNELYTEADFEFNGTAEAARTDAGTTNMGLAKNQFTNISKNFENVIFVVNDGYQTVEPIDVVVTIVGNNNTAVYDGKEHSVSSYVASTESELYDVTKDFTFSGEAEAKRTEEGTTNMGLTADQFENTNPNFETVTFQITDGYQTITPIDEVIVTITGHTSTVDYDGTEHTVSGYDVEISNELYTEADFTFSGTAEAVRTDAGTTEMGLSAEQFENTNSNFSKVTFVVTDGYQTVNPIDVTVTITEHSDSLVYDGAEHTVSGYDVEISNPLYSKLDYVFSGTASVSGTNVGKYDMELKPENFANINENFANVEFVIVDGMLVIEKRNVTLTSATDTKVYNGTALTNDTVTVTGDGFAENEGASYDVTGTQTNVGTSDNTFTFTLNEGTLAANYNITVELGTLEITPVTDKVTVTITEHSGTEKYDGTEKVVTGYDVDIDNELYTEDDFTFSGNATVKGTNAGTYEMALKAADFINISKNFTNVEFVIEDGKLEITKRSVTLTSADDEKVYDGTALTNSEVTVSGDGFADGEGATYVVTGTQTAEGSSKNAFTYTLNAGTLADNYDIKTVEGTLTVTALTDEIVVTITENSGEYLYDGDEKTVSGYEVTEISNPLYTVNDFTFSGNATVSGTDAGTYEMELESADFTNTSKNFEKVTFVIVDGDLEITKRSVTMTSATDSKAYDGTALTNANVTVTGDGFATGEGATYDVTGSQTEFGTSSNTFTYTLNEGTKADNYIIKTVEGTLTVTASQKTVTVTITENSDTVMYDGAEHFVKGYEVTSISDPLYTVNDFTFSGNATVSGTDAGTYDMELKSDDFANISANFAEVEFIIVDGTLVIEKRNVTLTSATDSKVYDGTALTNSEVTVSGDGFAENEGATYDVTGTQTEFGTSSNTFTYTLNEGTKADNYIIKTVEGTLTVTAVTDKVTVVVTENSDTVVYDGEEHSVKGYEVTSISNALYTVDDFTFSGNATVNAVDAGVYDMLLTSGNFTNKSPNFANVEFVIVDGQLTINKRNVTLTSASDSKEYDGIALTAKTVEITAGSFAPNEGYTVNVTGSQTLVGKSENTFTYALTQNTKSGNYEITVVYGQLQVTDRSEPFAVVVEANSGEHVYDGQPFTVSGLKQATVARMAARIDGQTVTFLLNGETYTISGLHAERTETHVNPAAPTAVDVLPYSGYEVAITGTPVITDSEGNDVTKQFTVETISGLLTIHPAPVTMVSGDATKPYDGTELINHEVTATGFVEGEGAEYAVTGTQTLVGSSENAFTYTLNEGTQAQDYRIETTFGTLTVTAPEDYEIIDKSHTTETLYRLGDTVTFDITVKNIFSEEAKVVITEQEGVSILWNGQKVQSVETTIPAGETITLQAEYTLQEKDILAGEYTNVVDANIKATVDKIPYEGDDDDDDKVDEIEDPKAKLTLDKVTTSTPANGSKYVVGETITYQITATNSGNLTLHDVVIYDLLTGESQSKYAVETDPVEYTFELDVNLAPGESATVTYTHTVTEEDLGKNLINAVTGSAGNSSETDDEKKNDTPTDVIPDEVKDPTDDIRRDLDVEKNVLNYQDPYRLGSFIEYEIVVTNRGNVTERDVIVSDIVDSRGGAYYLSFTDLGGGLLLPGNRVQIPSIAPGETVTILCHYWIGADDEALPVNNKAVVESADGETGDEDDADTVMVEKLYTLTIYYLTDDWQTVLAPEYHDRYSVGYTYYVESPEIEGYEANYKAIWSGWDGMPEHDVVCYVLYSKLPEETTEPTTEPTDPSEETTEPTTAPTEPTYDLTEIPEEEVPLGDVDLGDHTCCIMHFLIMLVAMILLGFYTKDRKKYQERIHELKRSLAAEDAAAAAAGEEQA